MPVAVYPAHAHAILNVTAASSDWTDNVEKLVLFDVDGTLLPEGHARPPESALAAIARLRERGIGVALCTGRHVTELAMIGLTDIPFDAYALLNGQLCLDRDMRRFFSNPIEGQDKREIVELFRSKEVPVVIVEEKRMYFNYVDAHVRQVQADISTPVHPVADYDGADILMASVYTDGSVPFTNLRCGRWHRWALDVYPPTGGKANGIRALIRHFGVAREDVVAFGDAENDIEMLGFAGTAVAMGNAYPEVKAAADFVTTDADADGIWNGLSALGLI